MTFSSLYQKWKILFSNFHTPVELLSTASIIDSEISPIVGAYVHMFVYQ